MQMLCEIPKGSDVFLWHKRLISTYFLWHKRLINFYDINTFDGKNAEAF